MIPVDQRSDVVATLIVKTQQGLVTWSEVMPHDETSLGLFAGLPVMETHFGDLVFRIAERHDVPSERVALVKALRGLPLFSGQVVLEVSDEQDRSQRAILVESDDLTILRDLYEIVGSKQKQLRSKIERFIGNTAR